MVVYPPVTLSTPGVLPGRLREDGYELPANLSYERWLSIGETLQQMERSIQWWLGDWWNYGERHYGEMASQASKDHVKDITGYTYSTVTNAATVAKKFDGPRRRENLSWSHHEAVSRLDPEDADTLLDDAEARGLNVFAVRDRVREHKESIRGHAIRTNGDPVETEPPLIWVPQRDELTDDARQELERRLSGIGKAHRTGYERAWLDCLLWTDQRDCFTEWKGPA